MKNKILLINTNQQIKSLLNIIEKIIDDDFFFLIYTCSTSSLSFKENQAKIKKIKKFPSYFSVSRSIVFLFGLPVNIILIFTWLAILKFKQGAKQIICTNWIEKFYTLIPAKLLGYKIIWIEYPESAFRQVSKLSFWYLKIFSKNVYHLTFRQADQLRIKQAGFKSSPLTIRLDISNNQPTRQENIFNSLARADSLERVNKFFTLGTIIDLDNKQKLEVLFGSLKKCLTVIPNIQLIIIGDGEERKALSWLAKKMGIDNLIWFVGKQKYLHKWFENIDVFVVTCALASLEDIYHIEQAFLAKLPIIAQASLGLEDYIINNENGILLESDDSENLAQAIIKLKQNKSLRFKLGERGYITLTTKEEIASGTKKILEILKSL